MRQKKWKVPKWMNRYSQYIPSFDQAEEFMNCKGGDCNLTTNAPKALMCVACSESIKLMIRLYNAGCLYYPEEVK